MGASKPRGGDGYQHWKVLFLDSIGAWSCLFTSHSDTGVPYNRDFWRLHRPRITASKLIWFAQTNDAVPRSGFILCRPRSSPFLLMRRGDESGFCSNILALIPAGHGFRYLETSVTAKVQWPRAESANPAPPCACEVCACALVESG